MRKTAVLKNFLFRFLRRIEIAQLAVEGGDVDAEDGGRLLLVASRKDEGLPDSGLFDALER
jgi:hypothetical protein